MARGQAAPPLPHGSRKVLYTRDRELLADETLAKHFTVIGELEDIRPGDRVLCRFSLLPFADHLAEDIRARGGHLVHDLPAHNYIADMRHWIRDLGSLTPKTWFDPDEVTSDGPFFVKGVTNARKDNWCSCYAGDRAELAELVEVLRRDPLIGQQALAIREYVPLVSYGNDSESGVPVTDEYRFWVADGQVIAGGYYWTKHLPDLHRRGIVPDPSSCPPGLLAEVGARVGGRAPLFVVDVAQAQDGGWIVVELNDPTMSGLAGVDPAALYRGLAARL